MAEEHTSELELRDFLRVFRRRKAIIVLCVGVVVCIAVAASYLQTPMYAATSRVLLQPRSTESLFDANTGQRSDPSRAALTEIQVLQSQPVQDAVRKKLGVTSHVAAQTVGQTDVVEIRAENTVAKRAADVADAYATSYIEFRRKQAIDDVLAGAQEIQSKIDDFQKQIDGFDNQVSGAPASEQASIRQGLASKKDSLVSQQGLFKQKLDQLQVDAALKTGGAQLVAQAAVATTPFSPRPLRSGILAAAIGLFIGIGLAFLIEYLDDSVKSKEDLGRLAPGIPVVGLIPAVSSWKDSDTPELISVTDPKGPAAEAYRTLRTSVQFIALEHPLRTLQVTSASAREGKTTTLVNLGVALARAGQRVIVVCCDLRRPRVHEFFGLSNSVGFTSVLLGKVPLTAALQAVPGQSRLSLLASGPLPPNPSELLSSKRTTEVLTSLLAECDIVLIDSPPVLPVTDSLVLSGRVDATLVVTVAGATTRKDASHTLELLSQVDAPVVGLVLNGVTGDNAYGYSYGYYGPDETSKPATNGEGSGTQPVTSRRR